MKQIHLKMTGFYVALKVEADRCTEREEEQEEEQISHMLYTAHPNLLRVIPALFLMQFNKTPNK